MPFFCGKKNKEDAKDPPYGRKGIEDPSSALLSKANSELTNLKEEHDKLQQQLRAANLKLAENSKTVQEQFAKQLLDVQDEVQKYKKQLADVETENTDLKEKLQSATKDVTDNINLPGNKDLSDVTSKLESDLKNLQSVKETIEKERDSAQKNLNDVEEKCKDTVRQLHSQIDNIKKEKEETSERLTKEIKKAEETIKTYKHEKDTVENTLAHTKKQLDIAQKESHIPRSPTGIPSEEWMTKLKSAESELKHERDQRLEKEKELSRLLNEVDQINRDKEEILQEITSMQAQADEMKRNLENADRSHTLEVNRIRAEYKQLISEKDETNDQLLTRLSALTAAEVLDGNPNVSDISDPNRPQKLGEQLGSLYDDQWTDASDELEKQDKFKDDEIAIVTTLFELLKFVYIHCKEASDSQLARIEEYIFLPPLENAPPSSPDTNGTETSPVKSPTSKSVSKIPRFSSQKSRPTLPNLNPGKKTVDTEPGKVKDKKTRSNTGPKVKGDKVPEVPVEVRKGIKEYRKIVAKQVIPVVEKEVFHKLRNSSDFNEDVVDPCKPFISRAVEICWRMCVQDPPMCLAWDIPADNKFDTERYRAYTTSGSHVDYLVWPIIYQHEGGTILMKGVVQGKKS